MRLKTFHAPSMTEAMQMVRDQLGPDAIIVATHADEGTQDVRITAAVEQDDAANEFEPEFEALDVADQLSSVLDGHGTPMALADRLLNTAAHLDITDPTLALAGALDECFNFSPLPDRRGERPILFIGPPGCGKTVCIAKLAVRTRLAGNNVCLITTDTLRAGAVEQLGVYGDRLGLKVQTASSPDALAAAIEKAGPDDHILIDSTGANPHDPADMDRLCAFTEAQSLDAVVVLAAGGDAMEAAEISAAFQDARPTRLVVTQLDLARRLGSMLSAADAGDLPFSDVSMTPDIAAGLQNINPVSLARLLLSENKRGSATVTEIFQATGSN